MNQVTLVVIKPDAMAKHLEGFILERFSQLGLRIIAIGLVKVTRKLAEEHYRTIRGKPFFKKTISFFMGEVNKQKDLIAMIYYGKNAIREGRKIAGATNPEEASLNSLRGALGRVTARGIFENVIHVSSNVKEAEREIKLWFDPDQISMDLYPTKKIGIHSFRKRVWA